MSKPSLERLEPLPPGNRDLSVSALAFASPTRVAVISSIRLYREGLADVLVREGFEVTGSAAQGDAGAEHVLAGLPGVVLVDTATLDGTSTVRALAVRAPEVPIVALGLSESDGHVLAYAEAGVSGYVSRDGSLDDLLGTLARVARGEVVCAPHVTGSLFRRLAELSAPPQLVGARLTMREREIVELIDQALSNKEIARQLGIQLSTVKNHVHNILEKLQVSRRSQVAAGARASAGAPSAIASGSRLARLG